MIKNQYLLSLTEVKKIFKEQSKEALIELLIDSYKTMPQVKEYISAKYANEDTIKNIFEIYKIKVHDIFFPKKMRSTFKIGDARNAVNNFKKICSNEQLIIDLMLYYVEMGVEFTNTYGDIDESFYNSVASMYKSVITAVNKQDNSEIFNIFEDRLKAVVSNTSRIGWGFHDELSYLYSEIKWIDIENIDFDEKQLKEIKDYILIRLEKRNTLPGLDDKICLNNKISQIIDADEVFLSKMDAQGMGFSNDDENEFIKSKTGYSIEFIEFILWKRYCYEMANDYWQYDQGKCSKCGNDELYLKEVEDVDFADQVICKKCGTEFIRD